MKAICPAILLAVALSVTCLGKEPPPADEGKAARLPVMTWYHPWLEPGLSDMTLVCTVVSVEKSEKYQSPYWNVRLRIDERIYVEKRYEKRLENVRFLDSGDFRRRKVGERIVLFAGGEPYGGDDFLLPCWKGTASDLGIVLLPSADEQTRKDLLAGLRQLAKGVKADSHFFTAFAEFAPRGVAEFFIWKMRSEEIEREEKAEK